MTSFQEGASDGRVRTFIALPLPSETARQLVSVQAGLANLASLQRVKLRLAPIHQLHVTLAFLGEIAGDRIASVIDAVGNVTATVQARFILAANGLVGFPSERRPRVIGVAFEDRSCALTTAVSQLHEQLRARGFAIEQREFRPHVTLARLREPTRFDWSVADLSVDDATCATVVVYKSLLRPDGAQYEALYHANLG